MYVQNISNKDLVLNTKGQSAIIKSGEIQYIPDCLATEKEIKTLFGDSLIVLQGITQPKEFIGTNEQKLNPGTLYLTQPMASGTPARIFIGGGATVNIYGSDSSIEPKSLSEMSSPESCTGVTGVNYFSVVPKYIAIEGSATEIIVTGVKCYEVGKIA